MKTSLKALQLLNFTNDRAYFLVCTSDKRSRALAVAIVQWAPFEMCRMMMERFQLILGNTNDGQSSRQMLYVFGKLMFEVMTTLGVPFDAPAGGASKTGTSRVLVITANNTD